MELQSIKARFGIIGNSPALNHALDVAQQVAATDLTVLIVGESGVGKEAFSQIIHALSSRKHNSFIAVNCGAIPEGTIDSELFGHEKGAFTGAVDARKGYFETVNGGTIFLDEIGEMPLGTQARLLRVLETGEFIRVGSSKVQKTDVRVIAATNRELLDFTSAGKFREDLYYRLSTVPIRVPALRERPEDIPLLFRKFAGDFAERYRAQTVSLDPGAQAALVAHTWPGNVRELKNIAEQVSLLSSSKLISAEEFQRFLPGDAGNARALAIRNSAPVIPSPQGSPDFSGTERDILYKLLFELKRDTSEIRSALLDLAHSGSFATGSSGSAAPFLPAVGYAPETAPAAVYRDPQQSSSPFIIPGTSGLTPLHPHDEVEETLSITENEKALITRALRKHKSRRRDAAAELGISERTLYRKIKEYNIDE